MANAEDMELGDFIANVLTQIANGVKKANESVERGGGDVPFRIHRNDGDSKARGILFDIAVTIRSGKGGAAELGVGRIVRVGADAKSGDEQVHRVQFEVGIWQAVP